MQLTFEGLPAAVGQLLLKIENIEQLLAKRNNSTPTESEELFTIKQASELIKLSVPTIYSLVSRSEIPCMKKGKRLYFSKTELTNWIKTGKKKTVAETENETDNYLSNSKKNRTL